MAISRCKSAGKFRVTMEEWGWVNGVTQSIGHTRLALHQHPFDSESRDGSPILSTEKDEVFEGDLCEHELRFLRGFPGKDFNYTYRFQVTPLSMNGHKKGK